LCTTDSCVSGNCVYPSLDCDDGNAATIDTCINGICEHLTSAYSLGKEVAVSIFPNPNSGSFVVEVSGNYKGKIQIEVVDVLGKVCNVAQEKFFSPYTKPIALKNAAAGIYFVRMRFEQYEINRKVIVE
jgi:hypothetical protein